VCRHHSSTFVVRGFAIGAACMSFPEPQSADVRFSCGRRGRQMQTRSFVGLDVHKATISISVAEDGRSGPVRFLGVIPNTAADG
jgi:hypothetical protein